MSVVLVVDDSPVIRRVMSVTFEKGGYEVELAEDGQEALDVLEDVDVDVIFADINMPVMDGITMLKIIRESAEWGHLPVVMLTGVGEEKDREKAMVAGANTILTKPSSSSEIISTLQKLEVAPAEY